MYAFSDDLAGAWQQLFTSFFELLDTGSKQQIELCFDSDQSLLRDPALFFGHTCGYPLMKHLKDQVIPFCVPVFDVPGTDGKLYSSRLIVAAKPSSLDGIRNLTESADIHNTSPSHWVILPNSSHQAGRLPAASLAASNLVS